MKFPVRITHMTSKHLKPQMCALPELFTPVALSLELIKYINYLSNSCIF